MADGLQRLCRWYAMHCNDDWEHQYGVKIDTLDNPGWSLRIDLRGTELAGRAMSPVEIDRSETDWLRCRIAEDRFDGAGGPLNLNELIERFLSWANVAQGD